MADHLRQSNEPSEEQRGLSAESPQRVAPQESCGREDAGRSEAYAGLPRRRADSRARVAARQNVRRPQHARRRGERVAGRRGSGSVSRQDRRPGHRAGAAEPEGVGDVATAYPIREADPERAEADQDRRAQHRRPPQRLEKQQEMRREEQTGARRQSRVAPVERGDAASRPSRGEVEGRRPGDAPARDRRGCRFAGDASCQCCGGADAHDRGGGDGPDMTRDVAAASLFHRCVAFRCIPWHGATA